MNPLVALLVFVLVFAVMFKLFKGVALALLIFFVLELVLIIINPAILTMLADIALKARELVGS